MVDPAMARHAAPYLMEALARRTESENRLTEVLACVLAFDAEFRDAFLDGLALPEGAGLCRMRHRSPYVAPGTMLRSEVVEARDPR